MAADNEVSICISRLFGVFRYTFKGKTTTKDCVCIPVDCLSTDKNGNVWISLAGYADTKFERQTHSLKQKLTKAQYDMLPEDENTGRKVFLPFCGSIRREKNAPVGDTGIYSAPAATAPTSGDGDDLPF